MKHVYLTGSTGGIGQAIAQRLQRDGMHIVPLRSRLEDVAALQDEVRSLRQETPPDALIHAAGFGRFAPHETLSADDIVRMVAVNLTAPILLANLCLRDLRERRGHIVHIGSIEATRSARWSALYSATKGGLHHFSLALYEEVRKAGIKVTILHPDLVRTPFFDALDFAPEDGDDCALDPAEIAQVVSDILARAGTITELVIRPRRLGIRKKSAAQPT